jgi:ankyrin repeat protein
MLRFFVIIFLIVFNKPAWSQETIFEISRSGTIEQLKEVIQKDSNCVNYIDKNGFSPLILACYKGNIEVSKYLIDIVQDVNYQSQEGTALMAAVMRNNLELINLLLNKNANINPSNANGVNALMLAIQFKRTEIIKIFLEKNPNLALKDNDGKTAFEYATNTNDQDIIKLLKNYINQN